MLKESVEFHSLKIFNISPSGADLAIKQKPSTDIGKQEAHLLMSTFQKGIIGASRRDLLDTFADKDIAEYKKIMRFFQD